MKPWWRGIRRPTSRGMWGLADGVFSFFLYVIIYILSIKVSLRAPCHARHNECLPKKLHLQKKLGRCRASAAAKNKMWSFSIRSFQVYDKTQKQTRTHTHYPALPVP